MNLFIQAKKFMVVLLIFFFYYGLTEPFLKDNLKSLWKNYFVINNEKSFLFDSSIILNNKVWEASGYLNIRYNVKKLLKNNWIIIFTLLIKDFKISK
ncbi:MAG: hypothetical protein HPAVJP_2940 [Candidatus Hepatoplasma vulgare]|nr:MAG: hypothetical protein HPAVJP_2940 [Candidatus Hepatoplasma sp.]